MVVTKELPGSLRLERLTGADCRVEVCTSEETGVSFCTRLHFGRPLEGEKKYYIRIAYSGIDTKEIKEGLGKFKTFIESRI